MVKKTIWKKCKYCRTPFEVEIRWRNKKIYCSYRCGQKAFIFKNGHVTSKAIKALKLKCSFKGCNKISNSFIKRNPFCQQHYKEVKKDLSLRNSLNKVNIKISNSLLN